MLREYWSAVQGFSTNARLYLVSTLLLGSTTSLQYLFFNLYILSLGFDQAFVGLLAGLTATTTALTALPTGLFLLRIGYRNTLILGLGCSLTALIGWTLVPATPVLVGAAILYGLGTSLLMVASSPLMVAVSSERARTHLFGIQFGLNTLAGVAASLIGGYLPRWFDALTNQPMGDAAGYRAVLLVAAALTFAAFIPVLRLRGLRGARQPRMRWADLQSQRGMLTRLLLIEVAGALGAGMLMPFINVFYRIRYGLGDTSLGALFAISSLTTGIAALLAPAMAGRIGKVRAIVLTQALSIPLLLAMGYIPLASVSAAFYLVRTALMNMSGPLFAALAMGLVPAAMRPLTASLLMLAWNGGWALSSYVSGYLQVSTGFGPLFSITASLYIVSIVLTYVWFRNVEPPGKADPSELLPIEEAERF